MTNNAALAHCFMFIDPRTPLRAVTLETGIVLAQKLYAAATHWLSKVCPAAFDSISLVRVVTIGATHPTLHYRMMVRQLELCSHFQVTLETGLRRFTRIDDLLGFAAAFYMQATRPMARFATHVFAVLARSL